MKTLSQRVGKLLKIYISLNNCRHFCNVTKEFNVS